MLRIVHPRTTFDDGNSIAEYADEKAGPAYF
jgi:hypothetical protein